MYCTQHPSAQQLLSPENSSGSAAGSAASEFVDFVMAFSARHGDGALRILLASEREEIEEVIAKAKAPVIAAAVHQAAQALRDAAIIGSPSDLLAASHRWEKEIARLKQEHGAAAVEAAMTLKDPRAKSRIHGAVADPEKWVLHRSPEIEFGLPGFKLRTVGLLAGAGGASKTFLALQSAISVAVGIDLWGIWNGEPIKRGKAVFLSLEDDEEIVWGRVHSMMSGIRLPDGSEPTKAFWDDFRANFVPVMLAGMDFRFVAKDERGDLRATSEFANVVDVCRGARVTIVDTLSKAATGADENDAGEMGVVMSVLGMLAKEADTAVVLIHHVAKDGGLKNGDETLDIGHIRGSSVLPSNSRSATMMAVMNADIARVRFGDTWEDEVGQWTLRAAVKSNYGPLLPPQWLKRGPGGVLDGTISPPPRDEENLKKPKAGNGGTGKASKGAGDALEDGWNGGNPALNTRPVPPCGPAKPNGTFKAK